MILGLGGIYILIYSTNNDDDSDDYGEIYIYNSPLTNLAR